MKRLENMNILIVEDDPTARLLVKKALEYHGGTITEASTVAEGTKLSRDANHDMIILDLRLPDGNGYEICNSLRKDGIKTPILILSADQDVDIKVKNLNAGADDYLTKPFSIEELLARIDAIKRRIDTTEVTEYNCGELHIDLIGRVLRVVGNRVELTHSELNLLAYVVKTREPTATRDELANYVWVIGFDTQNNYISLYISYLPKKTPQYSDKKYTRTTRNKGVKVLCDPLPPLPSDNEAPA